MRKLLLVSLSLLITSPAFADGTIDTLSAGTALSGTERIPMFQTANPAVYTTPANIGTYMAGTFLLKANNLSDVANAATARTNLGLGPLATAASISAALDTIGSTQGGILYRGASTWSYLAPGTSGQFLETLGAAANPQWATAGGLTVPNANILSGNGTILGGVTLGAGLSLAGSFPSQTLNVTGGGSGTVGSGTGPAIAQYVTGTTTTVGPESVSAALSNPQGGPLTIATNGVANIMLAQGAANTVKGNFTGVTGNETDNAMPTCPDTSGNHLNYNAGAGISCGTSSSGGGTPGGSNTQVQYNNSSAFGGSSGLTLNGTKVLSMSVGLGSDATGDVYYNSGSGTFTRLGVGTSGQVLTVASGLPSWATPGVGGNVSTSGSITNGTLPVWVTGTTISGTQAFGTTGNNTVLESNGSGQMLAPVNTSTGAFSGNLTTNITGSTQCVQASSGGVLSGTGSACPAAAVRSLWTGTATGTNAYSVTSVEGSFANAAYKRFCGTFANANTTAAAATLSIDGSAAQAIKTQVGGALFALVAGEIPGGGTSECFQLDSLATTWIKETTNNGGVSFNVSSPHTVTPTEWAVGQTFVYTAAVSNPTLVFTSVTGYPTQGGITVAPNVTNITLQPAGTDGINSYALGNTVLIPSGTVTVVTSSGTAGAGAWLFGIGPAKEAGGSWLVGVNMTSCVGGPPCYLPITHYGAARTIASIVMRNEVLQTGTATVDVMQVADGSACSTGTIINTTQGNAAAGLYTSQTLFTSTTPVVVAGSSEICLKFAGAGWASTTGMGSVEVKSN